MDNQAVHSLKAILDQAGENHLIALVAKMDPVR